MVELFHAARVRLQRGLQNTDWGKGQYAPARLRFGKNQPKKTKVAEGPRLPDTEERQKMITLSQIQSLPQYVGVSSLKKKKKRGLRLAKLLTKLRKWGGTKESNPGWVRVSPVNLPVGGRFARSRERVQGRMGCMEKS